MKKDKKIEIVMSVCLLVCAFCLFACATRTTTHQKTSEESSESYNESFSAESNFENNVDNNLKNNLTQEQMEKLSGKCVVLDAGHGANDSGKVGINKALEKDINLSIVYFLKEQLESIGIKVILTRESDAPLYTSSDTNKKMADMKKRISIIEESGADIVVSIHQNSYPDESVKGPQVFYYAASSEGEKLAVTIQESFSLVVGKEKNRRLAKANSEYYLLLHTPCVCVIAECGFLSNYEEAQLLVSEDYQKKMAEAIAEGIVTYLAK